MTWYFQVYELQDQNGWRRFSIKQKYKRILKIDYHKTGSSFISIPLAKLKLILNRLEIYFLTLQTMKNFKKLINHNFPKQTDKNL